MCIPPSPPPPEWVDGNIPVNEIISQMIIDSHRKYLRRGNKAIGPQTGLESLQQLREGAFWSTADTFWLASCFKSAAYGVIERKSIHQENVETSNYLNPNPETEIPAHAARSRPN